MPTLQTKETVFNIIMQICRILMCVCVCVGGGGGGGGGNN